MKVMTLFGTRPEIIRLSQVIKQLDKFCDQVLVHTGQNYDPKLSDIFLEELDFRLPDRNLEVGGIGEILECSSLVLRYYVPDRLLILGDTDSGLAAIAAARMGIPVYHMEAGNRCYDNRVPEEINRRIIDHCSDVLMPYTHRSKENLIREGIERQRIFVIGNPIYEVLNAHHEQIEASDILEELDIESCAYFLATLHRAENVDNQTQLKNLLNGLDRVAESYQEPVIVSVHPRTADRMQFLNLYPTSKLVRLIDPLGFFDFVKLERNARCVLSDSGTVQEECCIYNVPNVTLRSVTERAETIECGSAILANDIKEAVDIALGLTTSWMPPTEYLNRQVSATVTKIVLGV